MSALNVLIVDDSLEGAQARAEYIGSERPEWTVDVVGSLSEARAAMAKKHYDVYLLDLDLSGSEKGETHTGDALLPEIADHARNHSKRSVAFIVTGADAGWQYDRVQRIRTQRMNSNIDQVEGIPVNLLRKGSQHMDSLPERIESLYESRVSGGPSR